MAPFLVLISFLIGCGKGDPVDECDGIGDAAKRDECFASVLPEVFKTDPARGQELTETKIADPQIRDFVYLTVTRQVDPGSYKWCEKIKEPALIERCRVIVSRPHLHRELLNLPNGPNAAGEPPPGPIPGSPPPGARSKAPEPPGAGQPGR